MLVDFLWEIHMKCVKCGAELLDGDMFCGECGAKVEVKKESAGEYEILKLSLKELEELEAKDHDPKVQFALYYYSRKSIFKKGLFKISNLC